MLFYNGFLSGMIPYIMNLDHKEGQNIKDIKENGKYGTMDCLGVDVKVAESGELTPEAEQEILNEEY